MRVIGDDGSLISKVFSEGSTHPELWETNALCILIVLRICFQLTSKEQEHCYSVRRTVSHSIKNDLRFHKYGKYLRKLCVSFWFSRLRTG